MMSLSSRRVLQRGGSLLDGVLQDRISGEVGWQQKSYPLGGDGKHALVWVYSKDGRVESGSDRGWVDYLQWTPSGGGGGSSTTDWEQITYTYDPSGRRIAKLVSPPGGGDVDGVVTKAVCGPVSGWRCGQPPEGRWRGVRTLPRENFGDALLISV